MSHYRFSFSWARVLPNGIGFAVVLNFWINQPAGVEYNKRLTAALKAANIKPMVGWRDFNLTFLLSLAGLWWHAFRNAKHA